MSDIQEPRIKYEKCITCQDKGTSCDGPDLLLLEMSEFREWVRRWVAFHQLTIKRAAEACNVPEGTMGRFLSRDDYDFRYSTIHAIAAGVVFYGKEDYWPGENPCPATSSEIQALLADLENRVSECEQQRCVMEQKKDRIIDDLREENANRDKVYIERMAEQRQSYEERMTDQEKSVRFLRDLAEKREAEASQERDKGKDYLARIDEKNRRLEERGAEIRRLNIMILDGQRELLEHQKAAAIALDEEKQNSRSERRRLRRKLMFAIAVIFVIAISLSVYLVWDLTHPGLGFFVY